MTSPQDPRLSDEATGLPPLHEVEPEIALLGMAWVVTEGIVQSPFTGETTAVRYLSVRGLAQPEGQPEWHQAHIAIPAEAIPGLIAALQEPF